MEGLDENSNSGRPGPGAIARTAEILRVLSYHGQMSAREVARFLDEDKSTIQRAMQALEVAGLLARDAESELWAISETLSHVVERGHRHRILVKRAEPFLVSLYSRARHPVRLAVPYGAQMLHIYRLPLRADDNQAGYRDVRGYAGAFPVATTALGLAYLANLDNAARTRLLSIVEADTGTDAAVDHADLAAQIDRVRRDGYAVSLGRFQPAGGSIAAAVRDAAGTPIAAVGVLSSRDVSDGLRRDALGTLVREIAGDITHMLRRPAD